MGANLMTWNKKMKNLQVNDDDKHKKGGQEVPKIGQVFSEESSF